MDSAIRCDILPGKQFPMKPMALAKTGLFIAIAAALGSCAAVKNSTSAAAAKVSSYAKLPDVADMPIARILPGQRVKVVEVREKDLKELPTGKEKAMAYRSGGGFWIFGGPVDFKEPTLPEPGSELDGSLLPPRMP
jgi:hypothetical protein